VFFWGFLGIFGGKCENFVENLVIFVYFGLFWWYFASFWGVFWEFRWCLGLV